VPADLLNALIPLKDQAFADERDLKLALDAVLGKDAADKLEAIIAQTADTQPIGVPESEFATVSVPREQLDKDFAVVRGADGKPVDGLKAFTNNVPGRARFFFAHKQAQQATTEDAFHKTIIELRRIEPKQTRDKASP
jgi:hypothetical protein